MIAPISTTAQRTPGMPTSVTASTRWRRLAIIRLKAANASAWMIFCPSVFGSNAISLILQGREEQRPIIDDLAPLLGRPLLLDDQLRVIAELGPQVVPLGQRDSR